MGRADGAAFIKICTYFPYPTKIWINAHEWAGRQATAAGTGSRAEDPGPYGSAILGFGW